MKLKKLLSFTAAAVVALTALTGAMTVSADTVDSGTCGDLSWTLDSEGVLTFTGKGKMGSPSNIEDTIPESKKDDYLKTYSYKAHKDAIKEVKIEEGATSIGYCAFNAFPNLETVVIPSTVTEFTFENEDHGYNYAFAECTSLKNLTLTEGMTALGGYAFQGCTSLESVTIPSSITDWYIYTFYGCSSLKNITLSEGLKVIGAAAFAETAVQSLVIPSTIESWNWIKGNNKDLNLSGAYTGLAFANCEKLSSVVFKDGIKRIAYKPFQGCKSLKKVVIPSSVISVCYAFYGCTGLQEAYIEEGAQMEGVPDVSGYGFQSVFEGCTNLKKLEIPAGIVISYTNARWSYGCSSLTDLYVHEKESGWFSAGNDTSKIHCYFDSTTYNKLLKDYDSERLVNIKDEISAYKDTIQSRLNDAKSYDETKYTPESYGVLKALIEKAEKYGDDSNIMSMEQTASDIRAAIKALEKKPDEPVTDPTSDDKSDPTNSSNNTSDSSNNKPTPPAKTEPTTAKAPVQNNNNSITKKPANKVPSTPKVTVTKPAKVKAVKLIAKKKKLNVKWKKVSGATGYEVTYATNNKFTKNKKTVKVKKNKVTLKRLKSKKKYYVKVRAYKKANGSTNYGKWSKVIKKKAK